MLLSNSKEGNAKKNKLVLTACPIASYLVEIA